MISPHLLIVDCSYSYRTYYGSLESPPPAENMIERAKQKAIDLWGERPTLIIEPTFKNIDSPLLRKRRVKILPKWTHMISAHGPAKNEENDGSELVILWWSEMTPDTDRALQAVDWEKHAKDFQY